MATLETAEPLLRKMEAVGDAKKSDAAEAARLREQIRRVEEAARDAENKEEKRLREAIRRNPKNAAAHWALGDLLKKRADSTLHRALSAHDNMSGPPALVCAVCAASDVEQCVRCKAVYYCSRRCQKMHWKASHKRRCIPAAERAAFNTPSNGSRLWEAVRRGDQAAALDLALRGADVNYRREKSSKGCSPLFVAAELGHGQIVRDLLEASADKDLAAIDGATPLYVAVQNGHEEVVRALLGAGADRNSKTDDGCAPLHMAAEKGNPVIVRALLNAGAEPDSLRKNGCTPLFIAAQEGHTDVVCVFIGAGANKDLARTSGATPLHVAAAYGHAAVVSALLDAGADKSSVFRGDTALELAKTAAIKYLLR